MKAVTLAIDQICPNPHQPRGKIHESELQELAASIAGVGLLQPPLVHETLPGQYILLAGHRRLAACKQLGFREIPTWVIEASSPQHYAQAALVENLQRSDLQPMEIAHSLQALQKEFGFTHAQIAEVIGKKRSSITNYLRLLQLNTEAQNLLTAGDISFGHAKLLAGCDGSIQKKWLSQIMRHHWSVHQFEHALQQVQLKHQKKLAPTDVSRKPAWDELRETLINRYGLRVDIHLQEDLQKGFIKFYFTNLQDLNRLSHGVDSRDEDNR